MELRVPGPFDATDGSTSLPLGGVLTLESPWRWRHDRNL
jgi:hypothetical protein